MEKSDVYAKSLRSGTDEKRWLELWIASLQISVRGASKERVFELARASATDEPRWAAELD